MHNGFMRLLLVLAAITVILPMSSQTIASPQLSADNPFAKQSTLPYHFPPFDRVKDADFRPAFEAGMVEQKKEIEAIDRAGAATFENTIVALEKSGQLLDRVSDVFFNLNASHTNPEILKIASEMAPKLAAHHDAIMLDAALFARIDAIYQKRAELELDPESRQLLERTHLQFVRAGAKLAEADKNKLKQLNDMINNASARLGQSTGTIPP